MRKLLLTLVLAVLAIGALRAVPPPNLDRAIAAQRALVQKQPTAERWNDLGNLLQLGGHDDDAREAYEKALALDPKLTTAHYNLALLLEQSGSTHKAMQHLRELTELEPGNAWAWYQIGAIYEQKGDRSPAIRAYARAFALDPRLSFTDVNPQIVDNKLVAESLLTANEERSKTAEAPRQYEEPKRITKLLLPQVPAAAPTPAPAPATAQGAPMPAPGTKPPVIGPQDLRHGAAGGVTAGSARNPYAGQQQQQQQQSPDASYGELLRQRLLEQQQEQEQQQGADQQQPQATQPGMPPGVGVPVYVPQPRSSGQLEQRLDLPGRHAAPAQQPAR